MIEKMKAVQIVTTEKERARLLDTLRSLEILHLAERAAADPACTERFAKLSKTAMLLKDYEGSRPSGELLTGKRFDTLYERVLEADERKKALTAQKAKAVTEADRLRGWGPFLPDDVTALREAGIDLHFYRTGKKEYRELAADDSVRLIRLAPVDKMETFATVGTLPEAVSAAEFPLPERGLQELEQTVIDCEAGIRECENVFREAAACSESFRNRLTELRDEERYSAASNTAKSDSGLLWVTGYIPAAEEEKLRAAAKRNSWAYAMEDASEEDEQVPTKVRYNRITKLMIPVFDILGTVPGYREYDISFWFLCFFTLFFAMIIGDAGYGCLFLLGAVALHIKLRKPNNAVLLLYVLSAATVVWGSLTGTWFGLEGAMNIPFFRSLVIPAFANYPEAFGVAVTDQQNTIMKFCFMIGTVQLSLACIMSIRKKLGSRDLSWIADLGWLAAVCALYFVVLYLVIGKTVNLGAVAAVVVLGFLLVVFFGGMAPGKSFGQGLKAGLGDAFTVFLNTISAFGNIMSYIRLFAVGMASLAIAQSFNNMAAGFTGPAVVLGALIMILGHALNIVMGFLSVVVHGVRLNLLEFSGQLGMEWSGTAYDPFRKLKKQSEINDETGD